MKLSKEQMRVYQAYRRAKKKGILVGPQIEVVDGKVNPTHPGILPPIITTDMSKQAIIIPEIINPVILKMFKDLEARITALESREAVEPVVRDVIKNAKRYPTGDPADLFRRVVAEKAARVRGE